LNSRAVQVRLSLEGGKQVESELVMIGQRGAAAMGQLDRGMQGVARTSAGSKAAIQNTAFQIGDMAVQMAAGTSASRAMAMQLPQLLGGFGVMGAVIGAAFAVFTPFVAKLFEGSDAAAQLVEELTRAGGTASSVASAIGSVRDVAKEYAETIRASGGASSSAAALVIANSRREFDARKEVLAVEIELLRIRGAERAAGESALQSQVDAMRTGMMTDVGETAGMRAQSREAAGMSSQLPSSLQAGFSSVANSAMVESWMEGQVPTLLALRKLRAEGVLDELAMQKAEEIYGKEFASLDVASGAGAGSGRSRGGGGGGGSRKPEEVVQQGVDAMVASLQGFQKKASDIGSEIGSAITSGFSAAEDAVASFVKTGKFEIGDLVTDMLAQFARLATQHWITGPLAGLVGNMMGGIGGGFGSALQGALTSFDGGGWTGNGSRSGGLDGRGGFLAMLHPREQVYDTTRGQGGGGGIVMNVYARDAQSFARSRVQVAADAARMLAAARRGM
jgi:hypothetical protein